MVVPVNQSIDLSVDQGVPFIYEFATGDDPTDWTAHLQVRDRPAGLVFADLTIDAGLTIDVAHRRLKATFSTDQIALFSLIAVYDVIVTPSGGSPVVLARGNIYLTSSITR